VSGSYERHTTLRRTEVPSTHHGREFADVVDTVVPRYTMTRQEQLLQLEQLCFLLLHLLLQVAELGDVTMLICMILSVF
jgi:hypothetical protein